MDINGLITELLKQNRFIYLLPMRRKGILRETLPNATAGEAQSIGYIDPLSLTDSGVRIIRIRSNQEVPDYFTNLSAQSTDDR